MKPVYLLLGAACGLVGAIGAIDLAGEVWRIGAEAALTGAGTGGAYVCFRQGMKPRERL